MIKLIAIDMDGTLLNGKKHIDKVQKEAIHEAIEAGIKIVLCTGRPLYGILPFYEELGLSELDSEGYVILNNGCSIHKTKDWELIDQVNFTSDDIDYLYKFSEGYDINFTLVNDYYYFNIDDRKPTDELITDAGFVFSDITNISLKEAKNGKHKIIKIMFLGNPNIMANFQKENESILKDKYSSVLSQPYIYEILPKGNNKGTGLKKLAKKLGIKQEEIMAIGDGNNDIEMFEYAHYSVAMENGTKPARKAAKYQTDSNENNGVAKAIRKYALNYSE
ncbi:Cof-type HAD-IIB family hydrolase [Leptotrichia wadei]|jgi:HAD-superfamily hydrolase, subfamily IIB|uniref:Cof family hydrolase n=1 Tax=Leptotrichia wadei TaxID=157687 RepID=A0A510KDD6_9FUSO|nr:Cof-type HAD-IIB family hydrolase [Leptotrichia wadei]BBM49678.1 cof family hydrolase [Leptotrichia wadei]